MNYITLNNGAKIPGLGLGTYLLEPKDAENAVEMALKNGYELIDTANAYVNEKAVGRGMKKSGFDREKIYLETKLWPCFYEEEGSVEKTLARLGTDYIDLMILHQPAGNFIAGYKQLEKAYREGKLKAIGISNFTIDEIKTLLGACEIKPMILQVEVHPYWNQKELRDFCKKEGIAVQAWYPLGGRGNASIMNDGVIKELAVKYNKSAAQVIMKWHVQNGIVVIPGSKTESHIKDNINIFDFELSADDMKKIDGLSKASSIFVRQPGMMEHFAAWRPDVEGQE